MEGVWQLLENTHLLNPLPSLETTLTAMILAFVLGQAIAWGYCWTHSGMSYSRSYTQMLVVLPIVVSLVMIIIGNNIITAFGLIGALALIRFRNVLKDTRDTVFIFMSLVVGMAAGSQRYATAIAGTIFMMIVLLYIHWTDFGSRGTFDGYLRFSAPAMPEDDLRLRPVLARFCRRVRQVSTRQSPQAVDCTYQVRLRDKRINTEFVAALEKIEGVRNVSLILQEEMSEV